MRRNDHKYGDYNYNKKGNNAALKEEIAKWQAQGGYGDLNMSTALVANDYTKNLNRSIDMVEERGGKVYISFASTMRLRLNRTSQTAATQKAYKNAIIKAFPDADVISDPGTYVLESEWFYNSYYHLTTVGSQHRARLLGADILAQLAKEK